VTPFRRVLIRVLTMEVVVLVLLGLLQAHYTR
jgi:hypothetical protein